jgi:hypothetical protein
VPSGQGAHTGRPLLELLEELVGMLPPDEELLELELVGLAEELLLDEELLELDELLEEAAISNSYIQFETT